jgi:DNA polymerase-3 subunit alpha
MSMNESDPQQIHPSTCLRVHSEFSPDGSATIRQLTERAAELGYTALALTDVSVMTGALDLQREARRVGIKPIFGLDLPIWAVDPLSFVEEPEIRQDVITLLAENNIGLRQLFSLSTEAASLPAGTALPLSRLVASFRGLTAIVSGSDSQLSRLLNVEGGKAGGYLDMLSNALGTENLRVGIPTPASPAGETVEALARLAKARSLTIVSGRTVRFLQPRDFAAHRALLKHKGNPAPPDHAGSYMVDPEKIDREFSDWPEVTVAEDELVERCEAKFPLGSSLLPTFSTEDDESDSQMLRRLAEEGLKKRYGDPAPTEATERLETELRAIEETASSSYFLIVRDFVRYAKENNIVVGPGRGSAAGSIVCYSLGITELDPINHGLMFERFLRPDRVGKPDIDVDVSVRGRDQIILHLVERYGSDSVAQIATFQRIAPRQALRIAASDLGYGADLGESVAAMVPDPIMGRWPKLAECLGEGEPMREAVDSDPDAARVVDLARGLEGKIGYPTVHAAAVVVSEGNLEEHVPRQALVTAGSTEQPVRQSVTRLVTQFPMAQIEELGLLKLDLPCLRKLDLIGDTVELVNRFSDVDLEIERIPLDDVATFELFARGDLGGVFQFESRGMLEATRLVKPTEFEDLTALLALHRPGAMSLIPAYAQRKGEPDAVEYLDSRLRGITGATYGCLIYQEQLMETSKKLAGFTPAESDDLRRALGRKNRDRVAKMEQKFMDGAADSGINRRVSADLWASMTAAGDYMFNKAHAACYALIAYRTAYLKANYQAEFKEALSRL